MRSGAPRQPLSPATKSRSQTSSTRASRSPTDPPSPAEPAGAGSAGTRARRPLTMNIADLTPLTRRELAQRVNGGLEITLYWPPEDNSTSLEVFHLATE